MTTIAASTRADKPFWRAVATRIGGTGLAWRAAVARIEAATPAGRDRGLDGIRALAIISVVIGHFFVTALVVTDAGALRTVSPLVRLPEFAPVSWVLQLLGLFFLVGGYAGALGLARSRERGEPYRVWVTARLLRLGRPVITVAALVGAVLPVLALAGAPAGTLRTVALLVFQPLWFVAVYAMITALTPLALALDRRLGAYGLLLPVLVVAGVDAWRYGGSAPGWLGLVNVLPGWFFAYLLGVAWANGRIGRRGAVLLAVAGAALGALLLVRFGYPVSMVGVPGAVRSNFGPPSLLVPALTAVQSGLAVLARHRIAALLRRPVAWAAVAWVNLSAMTIFCWHQLVLLTLTVGTLLVVPGGISGLHDLPATTGWLLHRAAWLPLDLLLVAGWVAVARRFEEPWRGVRWPARAFAGALAAGFVTFAALVS